MATISATNGPASPSETPGSHAFSRDENILGEMGLHRETLRTPRRSQTVYDYQVPDLPRSHGSTGVSYAIRGRRDQVQQPLLDRIPSPVAEAFPPDALKPTTAQPDSDEPSASSGASEMSLNVPASPTAEQPRPRRPALPPPRRSYSVMDYEPAPRTHRLSDKMNLTDLPGEIHYAIFDFLDPIDGTCLGLTSKHFYAIHRRMHGTVHLSVRRAGPNDMEWAWHLAGAILSGPSSPTTASATAAAAAATATIKEVRDAEAVGDKDRERTALAMLRVRGQAYCRKCGISRCELHKHIQSWMGDSYEYCTVRQKFGPKAPAEAKNFCYLSNPKKPGRCGRHRVAKAPPASASVPPTPA